MIKTILLIFGTRPEAIKMAPVIQAFQEFPKEFKCKVLVTAQHRGLLDQVLSQFKVRPCADLNIMQKAQSLTDISVRTLKGLELFFKKTKPDMVLVHGDTTTTLFAALAAFYQKIPIGHVEAGLRSYDYSNPYPEEMNRRLVDAISTLHFAPTSAAQKNLLKENISPQSIFVTGNTSIDAIKKADGETGRWGDGETGRRGGKVKIFPLSLSPFILLTAHRRENFGRPIKNICRAVKHVAHLRKNIHFVYPVHPNPHISKPVKSMLSGIPNVHLLPALSYAEFAGLLKKCFFVVTDSGGLQEEAPSLGKPVLVLRNVTERPEAVSAGTVRVIGTETERVQREILQLINSKKQYQRMATSLNPYGDGHAAKRTVLAIQYYFRRNRRSMFHRPTH